MPRGVLNGQWPVLPPQGVTAVAEAFLDELVFTPYRPPPPSLDEAVDSPPELTDWTNHAGAGRPETHWVGQTDVSHDGVDAAQATGFTSSDVNVLNCTVSATDSVGAHGRGLISFWYRVDGGSPTFRVDTSTGGPPFPLATLPVTSGQWQQATVATHAEFPLIHFALYSGQQWQAFVDEVQFQPLPSISEEISEAVDIPHRAFVTETDILTGSLPTPPPPPTWHRTTASSHDGVDALESPVLQVGNQLRLSTVVNGPAVVRFWYRLSGNWGWFKLTANGSVSDLTGAEWQQLTVQISPGTQTLTWEAFPTTAAGTGPLTVYLDEFEFQSTTMTNLTPSEMVARADEPSSLQLATDPLAQSFSVENLPAGLTLNSTTGLVSGSPNAAFHGPVIFHAFRGESSIEIPVEFAIWPGLVNKVEAALDFTTTATATQGTYVRTLPGDASWWLGWIGEEDPLECHDGVDCLRSMRPGDYPSWTSYRGNDGAQIERNLSINVTGPARVSFWWRFSPGLVSYYPFPPGVEYPGGRLFALPHWAYTGFLLAEGQHTVTWFDRWYPTLPNTAEQMPNRCLFLDEITIQRAFTSRSEWAAHFGFSGPFDGEFWLSDSDGDRRTNLEEYVLGGEPNVGDSQSQPHPVIGHDYYRQRPVSINIPLANPAADVEITVEASENMMDWSSTGITVTRQPNGLLEITAAFDPLPRVWCYRLRLTTLR